MSSLAKLLKGRPLSKRNDFNIPV